MPNESDVKGVSFTSERANSPMTTKIRTQHEEVVHEGRNRNS